MSYINQDNDINDRQDKSDGISFGNHPEDEIFLKQGITSFDRFYYACLYQIFNDSGIWGETDAQVSEESFRTYLIDNAGNLSVLIDADNISADEVDSLIKKWFELLKSKALPERLSNIFLIFTFQKGIPDTLRKKIAHSKKMLNFTGKGVLVGYVDLADYQIKITFEQSGFPSGQSLKKVVGKFKDGQYPKNEEELYKAVEELRKKQNKFGEMLSGTRPIGTWVILGICVIMFIWVSFSGGSENLMTLLRFGANFNPLAEAGEWWRFIGSIFLHIGIIHLAINMFVLLDVGSRIEQFFGNTRFLALYFITGIAGSIASANFGFHVSAGASGAIFGLCGAAAWIGFRYKNEIPDVLRNRLAGNMMFFIIYNLIYGFSRANVDNAAHIGGLLAGVLFAAMVPPIINGAENQTETSPAKALFLLLAFIPFAIQGFVAYKAVTYQGISSYPTEMYKSSRTETSFTLPRLFEIKEQEKATVFRGPGMVLILEDRLLGMEAGIKEVIPEVKKADESQGIKITRDEIVERNSMEWLYMSGEMDQEKNIKALIESFITIRGKLMVRISIVSDKNIAGDTGEILRQIVDSVQITDK